MINQYSFIKRNPYHLVNNSPWPLMSAFAALTLTVSGVQYMHSFKGGETTLILGVFLLLFSMTVWWRDVIRESTFEGNHTIAVQIGIRYGMILFIVSECMFFFAFFWAYFSSSIAPTVDIGSIWPPAGITVFNPWEIPLLNTLILLLSGASVTWAHHAIVSGNHRQSVISLIITILLAMLFTGFQAVEYKEALFTISDGIYGSTFYLATGFHGFHVLIGSIFLTVCLFRQIKLNFTQEHHVGFEAAAWYWHFVDVVWLFLFVTVYLWTAV